MRLFHGSTDIIERPRYGGGKRTNDYGRGFYCTESEELSKEWACGKGTDGFSNIYQLDMEGLTVLNLNGSEHGILTWLAVLAHYRSYWENGSISKEAKAYLEEIFFISPEGYDIIRGYRADDSYFTFAKSFVSNGISLAQLKKAMHLGALGEQIVLKSEAAFAKIEFEGYIPVQADIYSEKAMSRDREARKMYRKLSRETSMSQDLYMIDILRERMRPDDPRLQ